jgi:hypothetical protein
MYPLPSPDSDAGADPFLTKFAESCRNANIIVDPLGAEDSVKPSVCFVHWPHHWNRRSTLLYSLGIGQPFAANISNKRTIWDVHDLVDHRTQNNVKRSLIVRYYKRMYQEADVVVVHEKSAIDPLNEYFGHRQVEPVVAQFGSFDVFHGREVLRESACVSQKLPTDAQIFLLFGTDRENRRHEQVIAAFLRRSKSNQYLCVAGGNHGDSTVSVKDHPRVRFFGSYLENSVVRDLFCAADFVIEHGVRQLQLATERL